MKRFIVFSVLICAAAGLSAQGFLGGSNVSARCSVGHLTNTCIIGFVLEGDPDDRFEVMVGALGRLTLRKTEDVRLANIAIPDPRIEVHDHAADRVVAQNKDWCTQSARMRTRIEDEFYAYSGLYLEDNCDGRGDPYNQSDNPWNDAVTIVTLPPGTYSLRPAPEEWDSRTGISLVFTQVLEYFPAQGLAQ